MINNRNHRLTNKQVKYLTFFGLLFVLILLLIGIGMLGAAVEASTATQVKVFIP